MKSEVRNTKIHKTKTRNMKRFLGSRVFRGFMAGMMVVCLIMIVMPDPVYGEERSEDALRTETSDSGLVSDPLQDADSQEVEEDDIELIEIDEEEDLEEVQEDGQEEEESQAAEGETEEETEKDRPKEEAEKKEKVSKEDDTRNEQKTAKKTTAGNRKLDSVPRTGQRSKKGLAGLAGTAALGLYLYSRKLRLL